MREYRLKVSKLCGSMPFWSISAKMMLNVDISEPNLVRVWGRQKDLTISTTRSSSHTRCQKSSGNVRRVWLRKNYVGGLSLSCGCWIRFKELCTSGVKYLAKSAKIWFYDYHRGHTRNIFYKKHRRIPSSLVSKILPKLDYFCCLFVA